ncbi:peptide ABC transporter permease [Caulobacter sp. Root655]|uniref:ABC transporter permease n=1 Tax=Caulobacter sp. Root655 TaxID=1736578 RepID=UPI0006F8F45D|nr:ABC transporter permease [Caulobacter sp. Root655]KRA62379.1 peptide ABC transporter permease [Caulobacter sp. Root655]
MTTNAAPTALFVEALDNLKGQGRRSLLALLGVVIGSGAIVALLNLGHMAQLETLKRFRQTGVDMLQVVAQPTGAEPVGLDLGALKAAAASEPGVVRVTPLATARLPVRAGARQIDAMVAAVPPAMAEVAGLRAATGRLLGPIDDCGAAALVGARLANDLSGPGAALAPGALITVGDYGFTVVGLLRPVPMEALSPVDYDQAVVIPLACARRVAGPDPTAALIRLRLEADPEAVGRRLTTRLSRPGLSVQVRDARAMIRAMNAQAAVHSRLLTAIGAISLLVGGIGVMNVMLMTVMERRREIGLRAAIGATPGDIRLMFLIEGVVLSLSGGALGAALGVAATAMIARMSGWTFDLALWVLPLGPGMAAVVGLIFSLYPAITASRVHPIEALRAD